MKRSASSAFPFVRSAPTWSGGSFVVRGISFRRGPVAVIHEEGDETPASQDGCAVATNSVEAVLALPDQNA